LAARSRCSDIGVESGLRVPVVDLLHSVNPFEEALKREDEIVRARNAEAAALYDRADGLRDEVVARQEQADDDRARTHWALLQNRLVRSAVAALSTGYATTDQRTLRRFRGFLDEVERTLTQPVPEPAPPPSPPRRVRIPLPIFVAAPRVRAPVQPTTRSRAASSPSSVSTTNS
jgi:hypothetical protein